MGKMEKRGWRSGWLSESQMDYQLIRMNRRSGVAVRGGRGGGGGREERGEKGERGRRCRGGGEVSYFLMSSPVLCALLSLSEPDWKWQQQQQHPCSSIFHGQMKNCLCIIPVEELPDELPDDAQTGASPLLSTPRPHTPLCCCIGVTHRLSHGPKSGYFCL